MSSLICGTYQQEDNSTEDKLSPPPDRPWCLSDFTFGPVLGTGSFGRVALATEKRSGGKCAIKTLSKAHIVKNQQVGGASGESPQVRNRFVFPKSGKNARLRAVSKASPTVAALQPQLQLQTFRLDCERATFNGSRLHTLRQKKRLCSMWIIKTSSVSSEVFRIWSAYTS